MYFFARLWSKKVLVTWVFKDIRILSKMGDGIMWVSRLPNVSKLCARDEENTSCTLIILCINWMWLHDPELKSQITFEVKNNCLHFLIVILYVTWSAKTQYNSGFTKFHFISVLLCTVARYFEECAVQILASYVW